MSGKSPKRPLRTVIASLGLVLAGLAPSLTAPAPARAYSAFELISAGVTYAWYPLVWRYEFKGGRTEPKAWEIRGRGRQYQQNGMLTIVGAKGHHARDVISTWSGVQYRTGRWESRIRTRTYAGGTPFRVQLALVPADRSQRFCGAQDILFLDYTPRRNTTYRVRAASLPNHAYTFTKTLSRGIGHEQWHVFGVEVTKSHIAWFVDGKVSAIEKRSAALSGVPLTMQARLVATPGARMQKTRLQLDWARYWTMKKKGKPLGSAPSPQHRLGAPTC